MVTKSNLAQQRINLVKVLRKKMERSGTQLDLKELGKRIGMVDRHLVALLSKRRELAIQVVNYKKTHGEPIIRFKVEEERLAAARAFAQEKGLDPNFIHSLFYTIIAETCRVQINLLQTPSGSSEAEALSTEMLKRNLLDLTREIAPLYDETYGSGHFATKLYIKLEDRELNREIANLKSFGSAGTATDFGCATGRKTFQLAEHFNRVVGYDISPAMIERAREKNNLANVEFRVADIEKGIPEEDNSISLVIMNLGTASDVTDIKRVLAGIKRVLRPDGRFLLSFYNAGALLYNCWFIPWPVSLAARMNTLNHCLEVRLKERVFSIPARAYTRREVELLLRGFGLKISQISTYPTISSILPNEFFEDEGMREKIGEIDAQLTKTDTGAYVLVTGRKIG